MACQKGKIGSCKRSNLEASWPHLQRLHLWHWNLGSSGNGRAMENDNVCIISRKVLADIVQFGVVWHTRVNM